MIKKQLCFLPLILLGIIFAFFILALFGPFKKIPDQSVSITQMYQLYKAVEKVHASSLSPKLVEIVNKRVACFGSSPINRLDGSCHRNYLQSILEIGRADVKSAPKLGDFLINVSTCPVIYSMCMGANSGDECYVLEGEELCDATPEDIIKCSAMEANCIERVLDTYWRGSPRDIYATPFYIRQNR